MSILAIVLLIILVLLISITWTRLKGAPWAPSDMSVVRKMLTMAELKPGELVYDLGCGDGRILIVAARRFGARAVGIEIDPLRYLISKIRIRLLGLHGQIRIEYGDFFTHNLSNADVVTCYLLQGTNSKLVEKLNRELRPDTRIVSSIYTFPALELIRENRKDRIFIYKRSQRGLSPHPKIS